MRANRVLEHNIRLKTSAIDIRPLRPGDCHKIGPLLREIWLDAYHGIQTDEELLAQSHKVHTPELIAREIDDPNMYSIVAVSDDRIIGHARSDLSSDVVDVARLYVLREFCGQGIGKALLWEIDTYFDPKYEVWLDVYEDNKRALNFYLSQGYQIMRRVTEVQTEGRDVFEFKMRKQRTVEGLANKDSEVDAKEATGDPVEEN
jgi:ribosomal protein S18 acetylase RimI-like enzyme